MTRRYLTRWEKIKLAQERVANAEHWLSLITIDDPRFDSALAEWRQVIAARNAAERRDDRA